MSGINNLGGHNVNNPKPLKTTKGIENQEQGAPSAKIKTKEHALDFSLFVDKDGYGWDNGDGKNQVFVMDKWGNYRLIEGAEYWDDMRGDYLIEEENGNIAWKAKKKR